MWRSTPARSSSSCSERLRPTDSGMKMRGKTTVDLSGSTGRREGTAPSTFSAGTSLTFGLSLAPPESPSRSGPELPGPEPKPVHAAYLHHRVLAGRECDLSLDSG